MSASDIGGRLTASGSAANVVGEAAGNTVQASSVHGGVHFHTPDASRVSVVPRQLPPPPPHLTGRDAELAALDRIARQDSDRRGPAIVVVSGQGGVGKSALALTWLQKVADTFRDGQLYVDLTAQSGAEPASLSAILARLLRAFGVAADQIPLDVAEAAALFRFAAARHWARKGSCPPTRSTRRPAVPRRRRRR